MITGQDKKEISKECFYCDGKGKYSFPEGAAMAVGSSLSDGWFTCEMCKGTGIKLPTQNKVN